MKRSTVSLILLLTVLVTGCSSSTSPQTTKIFRADINGNHWFAPTNKIPGIWSPSQESYLIGGANNDASISFLFDTSMHAPGTYPIIISTKMNCYVSVGEQYNCTSGSITFDVLTADQAKGTFQFIAASTSLSDTVVVSNGYFDIALTKGFIQF